MSTDILKLDPKPVWQHFYALTQIPRPSKHESAVIEFVRQFGLDLGLDTTVDNVGNVIIRKPATPGYEDRMCVCLQSHLDMVPQKNSHVNFDFEKDPIDAYILDDWVTARDTTLGADNGIGVATAMAVLQSKDLEHGPLEALFTIDEETGMTGAFGLKADQLHADILINLDSEDEGELYVGCAGGENTNITLDYTEEPVPAGSAAFKISVTGMKGGHSGLDICLGRGNAIKVLNRFLYEAAAQLDLRLATIDGGSLRNAIPREAFAWVTLPKTRAAAFETCLKDYACTVKSELKVTEPTLDITATQADLPSALIDTRTQYNLIRAVYGCPNGVIRWSDSVDNLVETSTNLAIIKSEHGQIKIAALQRSSVNSARIDICQQIRCVFELIGATVVHDGAYPGWNPNMDSPILKTTQQVYQDLFGKVPE
ncbi:MAG: aminoacyl-histidine dipeptidase, partial [Phycisphaerae bacterium]|nr:aminoacyl-histidine dipeptidase [Phycisphaerae bacterium]